MSEERQFRKRDHWQVIIGFAAFCIVAVWFNWQVLWPSATTLTHGFGAYYSASRLLSNGELSADIYNPDFFRPIVRQDSQGQADDIFNANPPTTTLMFWPLSLLPIRQARVIWTLMNLLFLAAGLGILLWGFGRSVWGREFWTLWPASLTFGLLFQPVIQNFLLGQAYILVFFLLTITTAAFFMNRSNYLQAAGGLALAFSLLLKTAGWPLLLLLLWLRRQRFLAWVIGVGVLVFLVTLPIFPPDMWLAYGRLLFQTGRSPLVCVPAYQTTRSWLCHLFAPDVFWQEAEMAGTAIPGAAVIVYFVLGSVFIFALLRLARKLPQTAFIGFVGWGVLFLPLGELHHHVVMLIPLVWFVVSWPEQSRFSRIMIFLAAVCYLIPFPVNAPQFQSGWGALLAYPYLAGAWLIFLGILWDHKSEMIPGLG